VKRVLVAAVIAAAAIIAMVAYAATKDEGAEVQTLTGTTLDGQPFDLADTRGTPTVVNFFFAKCVFCAQEAPDLVAFREAHPEVDVVGVAVYDSKEDTEAFVSKHGIKFPVVYEPEAATANEWGVTGYPTTFFLDADGVVQDTIVGAGTFDQFEASLETVQPAG